MRGGAGEDDCNDNIDMSMEDYHNCVLFFGCPPGSQVDAKSTIATDLFSEMKKYATDRDGKILVPEKM